MTTGLLMCAAVLWAVLVSLWFGPNASMSLVVALWIWGITFALAGWRVALYWQGKYPAPPPAPHEIADSLGRLADAEREPFRGKLPTLTEKERQAAKARLYLISDRARGRARIATFPVPPKGAA